MSEEADDPASLRLLMLLRSLYQQRAVMHFPGHQVLVNTDEEDEGEPGLRDLTGSFTSDQHFSVCDTFTQLGCLLTS